MISYAVPTSRVGYSVPLLLSSTAFINRHLLLRLSRASHFTDMTKDLVKFRFDYVTNHPTAAPAQACTFPTITMRLYRKDEMCKQAKIGYEQHELNSFEWCHDS